MAAAAAGGGLQDLTAARSIDQVATGNLHGRGRLDATQAGGRDKEACGQGESCRTGGQTADGGGAGVGWPAAGVAARRREEP